MMIPSGQLDEAPSVSVLMVTHVLINFRWRSPNGGPGLRVGASGIGGGAGFSRSDSRTPPQRESPRRRVRSDPGPDCRAEPR
mgnify:CR=1 FL=1